VSLAENPRIYDAIQLLAGHHVTGRRVEALLAPAAGQQVLDVGAGTGILARRLPPKTVYWALDNDPAKLSRLQLKVPGARCLLRSGTDTGLEDRAVDWTLCVLVAHHLDDEELPKLIAELARVTSDRLIFIDPLWTGARNIGGLLWRYDQGSHPRTAAMLQHALSAEFELEHVERYRALHRYLLCVGRPIRR
jgi:SAM-dependent methyltransferase